MSVKEFITEQPIEGVPLIRIGDIYQALDMTAAEFHRVSDNESYAIIKGNGKNAKLRVVTTGSGDTRTISSITLTQETAVST